MDINRNVQNNKAPLERQAQGTRSFTRAVFGWCMYQGHRQKNIWGFWVWLLGVLH